jgi:hypothetical protein
MNDQEQPASRLWRQKAAAARITADHLRDAEARAHLLAIAQKYELLAIRAEKREADAA